jgi:hypothetical protein
LGFSLAGAVAAKLAYPDRQCVHVTGDAGVCYMMGNFEAVARYKIGITTIHINNGGYSGYGPGFGEPAMIRIRGKCRIIPAPACPMAKAVGSRRGCHGAGGDHPRSQARARRERQGSAGLPGIHLLAPSGPRRLGQARNWIRPLNDAVKIGAAHGEKT